MSNTGGVYGQGDLSQLVLERQRSLYRIALSYTGSAQDAEDAVQEALVRAWSRRDTLRDAACFGAWLNRILINECKTLLRRRRSITLPQLPHADVPPGEDRVAEVRCALFALPEKYCVPLVLHLLEGYTLRETAALLSLPVNTVKTRVARAKHKLEQEVCDDTL